MALKDSWTLPQALDYIRHIQPAAMDAGWCILLAGGVLNQGEGPDLDLLAYPKTPESHPDVLLALLPSGTWSTVTVAAIYSFCVEERLVELIFQTHKVQGVPE